ncbi:MAG: putative serine protease HtrA [Gammaproteobacteria bacterium]|nr:putative serine protease HtrA [Gammaproteobacteria bacterium]
MAMNSSLKALGSLVAGVVLGIGVARAQEGISLKYPYEDVAYSAVGDYRALARHAAPIYVKVTIRMKAPLQVGRIADPSPRIVNGASGIIMDAAGHVVTAAHIVRSTDFEASVTTVDGRVHPARILRVAPERDLALLRIETEGVRFPAAEPAGDPRADQSVLAIGTPDNRPGVVTVGRITSPRLRQRFRYGDFGFEDPVALAMRIEPGHSGGPVVDSAGHLVGMIVGFDLRRTDAGEYVSTGAAYAVSAADLLNFIRP